MIDELRENDFPGGVYFPGEPKPTAANMKVMWEKINEICRTLNGLGVLVARAGRVIDVIDDGTNKSDVTIVEDDSDGI
jgi:hypothetical protein